MNHRIRVPLLAFCLCLVGFAASSYAQRGGNFALETPPTTTPSNGFPGIADSNLARKGHWVIDSFFNIDYGVTERLTVGINAIAFSPIADGHASGLAKLRYRMFSTASMSSTLSVWVAHTRATTEDDEEVVGSLGWLSSNTTWYRSWGAVTASFLVAQFRASTTAPSEMFSQDIESRASLTGFGAIISYERFFTKRFGGQVSLATAPVVLLNQNDPGSSISASISDTDRLADRTLVRGLLHLRLGDWLLSGGTLVAFAVPDSPIPWLSAAWSP